MTAAEASRTRTSLIQEVTPGTQPAGAMLVVPKTNCTLRDAVGYRASDIIRSDANVQGVHKVSDGVTGGLATELQYAPSAEALGLLIAGAFRSTFTAAATQSTGVTCTTNVLSAGTPDLDTICEVGDIVRVRTSGDVLLGYYRVTIVSAGAHTITVEGTLANGSNYKVLRGARIKNGTTDKHFSIEHARLDAALFHIFRGMGVGSMGIRVADEQLTTVAFGLEGMNSERGTSTFGASGHTDPTSYATIAATSVPVLRIGGTEYEVMSASFDFANNLRARRKVGTSGPTSIGRGTFTVTGSVDMYLDAWTELTKYEAGTASAILLAMHDEAGNGCSLSLPTVKWTDGSESTDRKDTDDMARLRFQAEMHATELVTARLQFFLA